MSDPARLANPRVWIIDPLDGTKEFIKRIPEFGVSIALSLLFPRKPEEGP